MSDEASQEFKISIISTADNSGFASAGAGAKQLAADMGVVNVSQDEVNKILQGGGEKFKDLGNATKEAGEKMGESRREMREMGNELGRSLGLANGGALMMGGMMVAAVAAGASIEFLKNTWVDIQNAIQGPLDLQVNADPTKIEALAQAYNQYAEARKKANDAANSAESQAANENKALEDRLKLLQDIIKAEEDEALANLALKKDSMSADAYQSAQNQIKAAFGQKGNETSEQAQADKIATMQQEAARLRADSAAKQAQANAVALPHTDSELSAQESVKANAEAAQKAIPEIQKNLELIGRLKAAASGNSPAEYDGVLGAVQKQQDIFTFRKNYGDDSTLADATKLEQQRLAQSQQAIRAAAFDDQDEKKKEKKKADLGTEAGDEAGKADALDTQIKQAIADLFQQTLVDITTEAIKANTNALGAEGGANSLHDVIAAINQGQAAQAKISSAIVQVGNNNKEAHDALLKALADQAAELKRLKQQVQAMAATGNK